MRFFRLVPALVVMLAVAVPGLAQSRGNLRITGKVLDAAGQPVADAQVRAAKRGETQPQVFNAKTNDKGEYSIRDLAPGEWVIEAMKEGVGTKEAAVTLVAEERSKSVDLTLAKAAPVVDPSVEINAEHQRAVGLAQSGKIPEARKVYEDLLSKHPTVFQLHAMLANMYAAENNTAKGMEHIKIALEKDPENVDYRILSAELMMESGDKEGARTILEAIDVTKAKDPRAFTNLAINQINAGKSAEAIDLLTKLIAQFPNDKSLLYYRGRAYIAATRLPEAKADLEAFVAAAPTAPQAAEAKKLLEQLTKK